MVHACRLSYIWHLFAFVSRQADSVCAVWAGANLNHVAWASKTLSWSQLLLQAEYRVIMAEYEKDHPKPPRRQKRARDPTELKRPQSAYFFFLADFREQYKVSLT